eukprot:gene11309-3255_t
MGALAGKRKGGRHDDASSVSSRDEAVYDKKGGFGELYPVQSKVQVRFYEEEDELWDNAVVCGIAPPTAHGIIYTVRFDVGGEVWDDIPEDDLRPVQKEEAEPEAEDAAEPENKEAAKKKLAALAAKKAASSQRQRFKVGQAVEVRFYDEDDDVPQWDRAVVARLNIDRTYRCEFEDGEFFESVPEADMRRLKLTVGEEKWEDGKDKKGKKARVETEIDSGMRFLQDQEGGEGEDFVVEKPAAFSFGDPDPVIAALAAKQKEEQKGKEAAPLPPKRASKVGFAALVKGAAAGRACAGVRRLEPPADTVLPTLRGERRHTNSGHQPNS